MSSTRRYSPVLTRSLPWLLAFGLLGADEALAHGDQRASEGLFIEDGQVVGLQGSVGLVTARDGVMRWSCAPDGAQAEDRYHYLSTVGWLRAGAAGLAHSGDGGCSWRELGLPDSSIAAFVRDGDGVLLATQATDQPGQLLRFDGDALEPFGETLPEGELLDLRRHGDELLALTQARGAHPELLRGDTDGAGWLRELTMTGWAGPRFLTMDLGDGAPVLAAVKRGAGELLVLRDGALTKRARLPAPIVAGGSAGDELWLLLNSGLAVMAEGDGPFLAGEGAKHCLNSTSEGLWSCGDLADDQLVLRRIDGAWVPQLPAASIEREGCATALCDTAWAPIEAMKPDHEPEPSPEPEPPAGCGCSGLQPAAWVLLTTVALRRRRS